MLQVQELRELQAEWSQEYKVRRQMLIERAKVCLHPALWCQEATRPGASLHCRHACE